MILVRPTPRDGRRASLHNQRVIQEMTSLLFRAVPRPRYAKCDEMGPKGNRDRNHSSWLKW